MDDKTHSAFQTREMQELRENSSRYDRLINTINGFVYRYCINETVRFQYASDGITALTGYTPDDLLQDSSISYERIIHPQDRAVVLGTLQLAAKDKKPYSMLYRIITANGDSKFVCDQGCPIESDDKSVTVFEGILLDAAHDKETEQRLIENERKYGRYFDNAPHGVFVTDKEGRYLEVNRTACDLTGYSRDELLRMRITDLTHEDYAHQNVAHFQRLRKQGRSTGELPYRKKNGTMGWWLIDAVRIDSDRFIGFTTDMTENRQLRNDLQRNKELLVRAQKVAHIGSWELDLNTVMVTLSDEARIILGAGQERIALEELQSLALPQYRTMLDTILNELIRNNGTYNIEFEFLHPIENEIRWAHAVAEYAPNTNDVVGTIQDITRRKNTEKALQASEERYQMLSDAATEAIFVSQKGMCIDQNLTAEKMFGYSLEEAVGKHGAEWIHPDDREHVIQCMQKDIADFYEVRALRKDGSTFPAIIHSQNSQFQDDVFRITTLRDISSQKEAEQKYLKSESRFKLLVDHAPDAIFVQAEGVFIYVNNKALELFGANDQEELLGRPMLERIHPDFHSLEKGRNIGIDTDAESSPVQEEVFITLNGDSIPVEVSAVPIDYGNRDGILMFARDIRWRKEAEEALFDSEEHYRRLLENGNDAIYIHEVNDDGSPGLFQEVNDIACSRLGYSREEMMRMSPLDIDSEDMRPKIKNTISTLVENGHNTFQMKHVTKEGRIIPVEINSHYFVHKGKKMAMSIARDITERKVAEENLRFRHNLLHEIIRHDYGGVAVFDMDMRYMYVSEKYLGQYEIEDKKIIGECHYDIFPDLPEKWHEVHQRVLHGAVESTEEDVYQRADGTILYHRWLCRPWYNPDGSIGGMILYTEIMNQWKELENTLRQSEEELKERNTFIETIIDNLPIGLAVHNTISDRTVYVNGEFCKIYGWPASCFLTVSTFFECVYPDPEYRRQITTRIKNDIQSGDPARMIWEDIEITAQDGSHKFISARDIPIAGQHLMISTVRDVTSRKRAEQALIDSEDRYRALYENAPLCYQSLDENGSFLDVNPAWLDTLGYERDEIIGKPFSQFIHPDWEPHFLRHFPAFKRRGFANDIEFKMKHKDGHNIDVSFEGRVGYWPDGRFRQAYCVFQDVTDNKLAQQKVMHHQRIITLNNRVANVLLSSPPEQLYNDVLDVVMKDSGSRHGLFGYINEKGDLECPAITDDSPDTANQPDRQTIFPQSSWIGKWGKSLLKKTALTANNGLQLPSWQMPLDNALAVPIVHQDTLIGELLVADKPNGYTVDDMETLVSVSAQIAPILHAWREEARQKKTQERLEDQLRQAQKMESIGRLAGGVAHDFNNLLTVIAGNSEIALMSLRPSDELYRDITEIIETTDRATQITRQLLAFSRKQAIIPKMLCLNEVIKSQQKMLGRLVGEDVDFIYKLDDDLWNIEADPHQLDQIIMNLSVNARDAIDGVGTIIIETRNVNLSESYQEEDNETVSGDYIMLTFTDSGAGMDESTRDKIFEPFFSTKGEGKGTGLGLSTVYGIVKQNNGIVHVYSEPGMGSTFKIYLPRYMGGPEQKHTEKAYRPLSGHEHILVVEDEKHILNLTRKVLSRYGYQVTACGTPDEAIKHATGYKGTIDLLLTDVVMPTMNGKELQTQIQALKPGIKTLFMSGYTANVIAHRGVIDKGVDFIQKPFGMKALAEKVREVIDK